MASKNLFTPQGIHDAKGQLRTLQTVLELVKDGFQFESQEGQEILNEAFESAQKLESMIENLSADFS